MIAATPVEGFSPVQRFAAVERLLSFYATGDRQLIAGYTPDERAHLAEVADTINTARRIGSGVVVVTLMGFAFIIRRFGFSVLRDQLRYACKCSAISSVTLLLIGWLGFDALFEAFHRRVFSAAPWQFDPAVSRLVNEFPPEYFQLAVAATLAITAAISGGLFAMLHRKKKPPVNSCQGRNTEGSGLLTNKTQAAELKKRTN